MSELRRKVLIWFAATFLIVGLATLAWGALLWRSQLSFDCGNDVLQQAASPDGAQVATFFRRSCGATTGYSYHVSLLPRNAALPDAAGNLPTCGDQVELTWEGKRHLLIQHNSRTCELKSIEVNGVAIEYAFSHQAGKETVLQ